MLVLDRFQCNGEPISVVALFQAQKYLRDIKPNTFQLTHLIVLPLLIKAYQCYLDLIDHLRLFL